MSKYFPEPKSLVGRVKVELDWSNYATKADLKNATWMIHQILLKTDLVNSKFDVDKLDIDKLKNVLNDLSNLKSKGDKLDVDLVKYHVVKTDVYNAKIKDIEDKIPYITNLATNTTLNTKINEVKNEILIITNLVTNTSINAKINEVKDKILSINNLATTTALTVIENKYLTIANISLLQKLIS